MFPVRLASLTLVTLILLPVAARGYDPEKRFTPEQLNEDFSLLKKALEQTHPGLNRYVPAEVTSAMFSRISDTLKRPMTEREFYLEVTRLSSVINCGHTRILPSAKSNDWRTN